MTNPPAQEEVAAPDGSETYLIMQTDRDYCVEADLSGPLSKVSLRGCSDAANAGWFLDEEARLQWLADANLCLSSSASASSGPLFLASCGDSLVRQDWGYQQGKFVTGSGKLCLTVEAKESSAADDPLTFGSLVFSACQSNSLAQQWAVGPRAKASSALNRVVDETMTIRQMCTPVLALRNFAPSTPGNKRILAAFGSQERLLMEARNALSEDCELMYDRPSHVSRRLYMELNFDDTCLANGTAATDFPLTKLTFCSNLITNSKDDTKAAGLKTRAALRQLFAQAMQETFGVPPAVTSGHASLVAFRSGLVAPGTRKAGGRWDDGGFVTGHFLGWLDSGYESKPVGLRFTDEMQAQAKKERLSGNQAWFAPWVLQRTGVPLEQLWLRYQATL